MESPRKKIQAACYNDAQKRIERNLSPYFETAEDLFDIAIERFIQQPVITAQQIVQLAGQPEGNRPALLYVHVKIDDLEALKGALERVYQQRWEFLDALINAFLKNPHETALFLRAAEKRREETFPLREEVQGEESP